MSGAPYDPTLQTSVHFISQSPHTFAFKLFSAPPGATAWTPLDEGTIATPEKSYGPFQTGTALGYSLLMGGNPNTQWTTKLRLAQGGTELSCSPTPDTGVCDDQGAGYIENEVDLK
jgi:hypothetical protein